MIRFLLLGLVIIIFVVASAKNLYTNSSQEITQSPGEQLSSQYRATKNGPFEIHSFEIAPVLGRTEIFTNRFTNPVLSLDGFYYGSRFIDLDIQSGIKTFEIELNTGGKLLTSLVYRYKDGSLTRIPVSTEKPGGYLGTVSSGGAEFKDIDNDGIKEMLVYNRYYPPEAKRTVAVYKFDGQTLNKYQEYEESTAYIYY